MVGSDSQVPAAGPLAFSASATFLFPGQPASHFAPILAGVGFRAVEFQRLQDGDAEQYVHDLERAGLDVALLNIDVGDFVTGGPGLSSVPSRASDFMQALDRACANAACLDARVVHIGPSRIPRGVSRDVCARQFVENLCRARDRLAPRGVTVSIEVLNAKDFPDLLVRRPEEALHLIEQAGGDFIGLQYDVFHAAVDGRNIVEDIETWASRFCHVQFADHPGRHQPGSGTLPLREYFALLRSSGFQGFIGAEYIPLGPVEASFGWLTT